MKARRRWWLLGLTVVLAGTGAWIWLKFRPSYDRETFRVLAADVFHPTFYLRFAAAREAQQEWVASPGAVAAEFIGRARNCPEQRQEVLSSTDDAMVVLITRLCPYSRLATQRQFRVDLARRGHVWEIEWAGQRYKCAVNRSGLAVLLITHSPFRGAQAPWARSVTGAIDTLSDSLNSWVTDCL
jgi:hypothetical protein